MKRILLIILSVMMILGTTSVMGVNNYTITDSKIYYTSTNTYDNLTEASSRTWGRGLNTSAQDPLTCPYGAGQCHFGVTGWTGGSGWAVFELNQTYDLTSFNWRGRGSGYCGAGSEYQMDEVKIYCSNDDVTYTLIATEPDPTINGYHSLDLTGNSCDYVMVNLTSNKSLLTMCWGQFEGLPPDTTPPTVSISYPTNLYHLDGTPSYEIKVEGTATDDSGISEVWIDNANFTNQGNETDFDFQNNTGINDAEYTVIILANDTLGNVGNDTVTFTLDTVNPLANLQGNNSFLADNSTIHNTANAFTFAYSVFDENINNVTAWISNGTANLYSLDDDSPTPNNYLVSASLDISTWADGTYFAYLQGFNHIPGHDQQRDFQFDICTTDWTCDGYASCNTSDQQACNSVLDLNGCGIAYAGDYSEFSPLSCNYCTSTWDTATSACVLHNQTTTYDYSNTCCADTGFPSDCNIPANSSAECSIFDYGDTEDIPAVTADVLVKILAGLSALIGIAAIFGIFYFINTRVTKK